MNDRPIVLVAMLLAATGVGAAWQAHSHASGTGKPLVVTGQVLDVALRRSQQSVDMRCGIPAAQIRFDLQSGLRRICIDEPQESERRPNEQRSKSLAMLEKGGERNMGVGG
jgi:hypothetical protein